MRRHVRPRSASCEELGSRWFRRPSKETRHAVEFQSGRKTFHQCRERLEAKFFELASSSGKPRGLRWTDVDFDDDVIYARHRHSGELSAFVAVTIGFEAIEGGAWKTSRPSATCAPPRPCFARSKPLADRWPRDLQSQSDRGHRLLPGQPGTGRAEAAAGLSSHSHLAASLATRSASAAANSRRRSRFSFPRSLRSTVCRMPPLR